MTTALDALLSRVKEFVRLAPEPPPAANAFTAEKYCGQHAKQLAFVNDASPFQHCLCARQAGKSRGVMAKLRINAEKRKGSTNLYLGLTGPAVRLSQWVPAWKGEVAADLPPNWHN